LAASALEKFIFVRFCTPVEKYYYHAVGILPYVLAQILG
jgi:hypothetical protein